MKPEDVPDEWVGTTLLALFKSGGAIGGPHTNERQIRSALTAVAPLIAKAERERCALIADEVCDPYGADDGFSARAIAAAIRALPDE